MIELDLPHGWQPRRYQMPLWSYLQDGGKRAMAIWHRQSGKDDVLLNWTMVAAHERTGTYWHCLPEYAQARKAIWDSVNPHTGIRRIDQAFPMELRKSTNEQEMKIRFENGSTWQVIGSDHYHNLVGASPAGICFSEWSRSKPAAWDYLSPMLEANDGWAAFISTPLGQNHCKKLYDFAMADPEWFADMVNVHETGLYTPEKIERIRQEKIKTRGEEMGQAIFAQEYLCDWSAAIPGAYYGREVAAIRREGRIRDLKAIPGLPVHTSWDLGVRDSTVIWYWQVIGDKLRVLGCYEGHGVGIAHYAKTIKDRWTEKGWKKGIDWVPHDARVRDFSTGKSRLETMLAHGLNPRIVPQLSVADGIEATRQTLPLCTFDVSCTDAVDMLGLYHRKWDDGTRTYGRAPAPGPECHYADSYRYLSLAWREMQIPEPDKDPIPDHLIPIEPMPEREDFRIRL